MSDDLAGSDIAETLQSEESNDWIYSFDLWINVKLLA